MQPKEGGLPGSLYEFKRLAGEARGQAELAAKQQRVSYKELPDRVRSLFIRFQVIELLEEVKTLFWVGGIMSIVYRLDGNPSIVLEHHSRVTIEETSAMKRIKTGKVIPADLIKIMVIHAVESESTDSGLDYDLEYEYFQEYGPVSDFNYTHNNVPSGRTRTLIDRRIEASQPPDTLKKVIEDYFAGEYH